MSCLCSIIGGIVVGMCDAVSVIGFVRIVLMAKKRERD